VSDSLALAREFGKPTFFITMTFNPNWPEITSRLRTGQHFTDIPAVVCRVFYSRLKRLKAFINCYFGDVLYIITGS
jgi:hypothetical protein